MTAWTEPKRSYSFNAISICSFVYIYFTPLGVQEYVRTPDSGTEAQKSYPLWITFFYFYSNTHPPIFSDGQPSITSATALECVIKIIFAHAHSPILSYKRPALYVPE